MGISDKQQKTATTQNSLSTAGYNYFTPPSTPDIDTARASKVGTDPTIGYRLGEKERQLKDSFSNPAGGYTTPAIRDAILRSGQRNLMQEAGAESRASQYDANRLNQSKNLALAGMTAPQLAQTSSSSTGSGTGTVKQSESPWATIAQVGASAAPLSI